MIKTIIFLVILAAVVSGAFALYAYKFGNDSSDTPEGCSGNCSTCSSHGGGCGGLRSHIEVKRKEPVGK